jgi:tetratricopeptide (TPR) repeat protein
MNRAPFPAYQGSEPYVFVCYSHEDSEAVLRDLAGLREQGLHIWYDEGVSPGAAWRDEVARAIEGAALFLYFVSTSSVESPHCIREVGFATDQNLDVLAVHLKATVLPRGLRLAILDRQAILKYQLSSDVYQRNLLAAVRRIVGRVPTPAPSRAARADEDRVHIGVAANPMHGAGMELGSSLARYLSWQGGVYRSHNLSSERASARQALLDYRIDVAVHEHGERVETSWQLARPETGEVIWANRSFEAHTEYHAKLDRVAEMIGEGALRKLGDYEMARMAGQSADVLSYGRLVIKAEQLNYLDRTRIGERLEVLKRAIELEPNTGYAHASLASLLSWQLINGASQDPVRDETTMQEEARLALRLEPNDPFVLLSVGATYCRLGRYERGLGLLRRSCDMAPTVQAKDQLARSLCFAGRPDEAIPLFEQILETMPSGLAFPYVRLAVALTQAGRLQEALSSANDAVVHFPDDYYGWLVQANLLAQIGQEGEARMAVREAQRLVSGVNLDVVIERTEATYGRTDNQRRWLTQGLRRLRGEGMNASI